MIEVNPPSAGNVSANASDFRQVFIARVHEVLEGGYRRMRPEDYVQEEEPAITGELRKAMDGFLRDAAAPAWADFFSVHDDPPVDDGVRKGKRRNRIDLRVDSSTPRPGARFSFEAKRLAHGFPVGKYLGDEGLGCFLSGAYAKDDDDAGMIGYLQDEDATYWAGEIVGAMQKDVAAHEVNGNDWWRKLEIPGGPKHIITTMHSRAAIGRRITIYHSLLLFRNAG